MAEDIKSKISELEKGLYSKDFESHPIEDTLVRKEAVPAPVWGSVSEDEKVFIENKARKHRIMKKFVQISIGFFIISSMIAGYIWWKGANIVSGDNIGIDISAPLAITGGDPFDTKFTITNDNKVSIDEANLLVEYPSGFYSAADNSELPRTSKSLGAIVPGQSVVVNINTLLYGEDNTNKEVVVTLEYRMAGSNAILKKTKNYLIKIGSSPVNVTMQVQKEVSSGQEIELVVDVTSNSRDVMSGLLVSADYPPGFTFETATPAPTYNNNAWTIPSLSPQEKQTIRIKGIIEGQEGEEKAIKISIGKQSSADERLIGVVYNSTTESSSIQKPVIAVSIAVNGSKESESAVPSGRGVNVEVSWKNNNPTKVTDATIEVKLKGGVLDRYSLFASNGGFYRSVDNTVVWDKNTNSSLASLDPSATGGVSFSFSPISLGLDATRLVKNPQIIFEVSVKARRVSASSAPEDITTFVSRTVKFETDLRITAHSLYFSGPFANTGSVPPRADKETTYAVTLHAQNSSNSVSNTLVKTMLPIYVKWLGVVSPDGEDISYNESTREVSWNAGRIPSGGSRDGAFQISLLPSVNQIGSTPALTGDILLTATDDFTNTVVTDKNIPVTTFLTTDPQFTPSDASVVN